MLSKKAVLEKFNNYPLYLWYETEANVFSLFLATDARTGKLKEVIGITYKPILFICRNRIYSIYFNTDDCKRIALIISKKIQSEHGWFAFATKEIYARAEQLINFSSELKKIDYSKKTNKELSELYKKYVDLFENMRIYSSIPTILEQHDNPVLSNLFKEMLQKYVSKQELNNVFSILTTPTKKSHLLQEEIERLKLATVLKQGKDIKEKVKKHTEKWNWKEYLFEGTPLTEEDFMKQINRDIEQYPNPKKRIEEIGKKHKKIIGKQQEYYKEYNLPKEIQEFAHITQDIVYLKYFTKGTFAESYYCVEFLLREIGKRLGLSLDDVRAMLDYEVDVALEKGIIKSDEIQKRVQFAAFISADGRCYPITEQEAEQILKKNLVQKKILQELKGQVACVGNVVGQVCIVNTKEDMKKMQEGNILVSVMTNPNMFPAMKIAKGIITDVGGLSCHAAIVARELQIPCIVGTDSATKVLRDGMLIELNGETGRIKILKE